MTNTPTTRFFKNFRAFASEGISKTVPTFGGVLLHVYLRLDIATKYESAQNQADALRFLQSLQRAATVAGSAAEEAGGYLLELQGSTIHLVMPEDSPAVTDVLSFAASLHRLMQVIQGQDAVVITGWRMTSDIGQTLVVHAQNLQVDHSFISIGNAANRPAKHLYGQLAIPNENNRSLKKYHLGHRQGDGSWLHTNLLTLDSSSKKVHLSEGVEKSMANLGNIELLTFSEGKFNYRMAADLMTPDGEPAPGVANPARFFATVVRADLDGFTKRVSECEDDEACLEALGDDFVRILNEAREYLKSDNVPPIIQMPWAGDNCTFAITDDSKADYDLRREIDTVDVVLGFNRNLEPAVQAAELEGWAYGVAGGDVDGRASGNFFVGRIPVQSSGFLVAAGEGVGRSLDAFGAIAPELDEVVFFKDDEAALAPHLQEKFSVPSLASGGTSSLYRSATIDGLSSATLEEQAKASTVSVPSTAAGFAAATIRPYFPLEELQ